jgi:hypothetical protein
MDNAAAPEVTAAAPKGRVQPDLRTALNRGIPGLSALMLGLLLCFLVPPAAQRGSWLLVLAGLLLGTVVAYWTWSRRGAVFGVGQAAWLFRLIGGLALGVWVLLLFEPTQRLLHGRLIELALGTPWEGLVAGLVWTLLLGGAPALGLAGWLGWRWIAMTVLDGRLPARVPHDLMWTGCVLALAALLMVALAPLGFGRIETLQLDGAPWVIAAQGLSLFVDEYGVAMLLLFATYSLYQVGSGFAISARAPAPAPPLVVLDLDDAPGLGTRPLVVLHRLACAWAGRSGSAVLVRPAASAAAGAGMHARWATAAARLDELFVDDAAGARRWTASWLGQRSGPAVRECFVARADVLAPLVAALQTAQPAALFLLLTGRSPETDPPAIAPALWPGPNELDALRRALPKPRSFVLVRPEQAGWQPVARLASLPGRIDSRAGTDDLVERMAQLAQDPPRQLRVAVIGRPAGDSRCDRLVTALDQRPRPDGTPFDAQRPPRAEAGAFDLVVLMVDPHWLAGEPEARAEAAALAPLLQAAAEVAVVGLDTASQPPALETVAGALAASGWQRDFRFIGHLSATVDGPELARVVESLIGQESLPLSPAAPAQQRIELLYDTGDADFVRTRLRPALERRFGAERIGDALPYGPPAQAALMVISAGAARLLVGPGESTFSAGLAQQRGRGTPIVGLLLDGATLPARIDVRWSTSRSLPTLDSAAGPETFATWAEALAAALGEGRSPPRADGPGQPAAPRVGILCRPTEANAYALDAIEKTLLSIPASVVRSDGVLRRSGLAADLGPAFEDCDLVLVLPPDDLETRAARADAAKGAAAMLPALWQVLAALLDDLDDTSSAIVVPVLLDGRRLASPEAMPAELRRLSELQAVELNLMKEGQGALDRLREVVARALVSRTSSRPQPKSAR